MKPKILISACFLGQDCRYDGGNNADKIPAEILAKLALNFELLPVCPEQLGGLSTPREPAEIRANGRVITKFSRTDVTDEFIKGARICVEKALENNCKIALLKQRSPSCGCGQIYDGSFSGTVIKGDGLTASALKNAGIRVFSEDDAPEI